MTKYVTESWKQSWKTGKSKNNAKKQKPLTTASGNQAQLKRQQKQQPEQQQQQQQRLFGRIWWWWFTPADTMQTFCSFCCSLLLLLTAKMWKNCRCILLPLRSSPLPSPPLPPPAWLMMKVDSAVQLFTVVFYNFIVQCPFWPFPMVCFIFFLSFLQMCVCVCVWSSLFPAVNYSFFVLFCSESL